MTIKKQANGTYKYSGYIPTLLQMMTKYLNFTYEWKFYKGYGNKLPNGSWNGIMSGFTNNVSYLNVNLTYYRTGF